MYPKGWKEWWDKRDFTLGGEGWGGGRGWVSYIRGVKDVKERGGFYTSWGEVREGIRLGIMHPRTERSKGTIEGNFRPG